MCLSLVDLGASPVAFDRGPRNRLAPATRGRGAPEATTENRRSPPGRTGPCLVRAPASGAPAPRRRPCAFGPAVTGPTRTRARRSYRGGGWGDVNPWSRRREMGRAGPGRRRTDAARDRRRSRPARVDRPRGTRYPHSRPTVGRNVFQRARPPIGAHQPIRPGARHGPARHTARSHGPQRTHISPRRPAGSPPNDRRRRRGGPGAPHRRRRAHRPGPFGIRTRLRGVDPGR